MKLSEIEAFMQHETGDPINWDDLNRVEAEARRLISALRRVMAEVKMSTDAKFFEHLTNKLKTHWDIEVD